MLGFEDAFFKVSANRMALYKRAYREAIVQGKDTDVETMSDFIADYVYNRTYSSRIFIKKYEG